MRNRKGLDYSQWHHTPPTPEIGQGNVFGVLLGVVAPEALAQLLEACLHLAFVDDSGLAGGPGTDARAGGAGAEEGEELVE